MRSRRISALSIVVAIVALLAALAPTAIAADLSTPGSAFIEDVFVGYFDGVGLASDPTPFNGRSDYGPFIAVGIPAGGLFTAPKGSRPPPKR